MMCPDPPDLLPLYHTLVQSLIAAGILLALQIIFRKSSDRVAGYTRAFFQSIARRKIRAGILLFLAVIGVRAALLPRLPIPSPGIHDEFSYLLMGDTFAHGRLSNPPHPMWISFEAFHVNWFPRYASMYPPAQGLLLAIGQWLGHPWFGVVLSCAGMCAAIYWMLLAWVPRRWALLGGIAVWLKFGIVSYWMNSYWGGAVAAIGGALVLGALTRILKRPSARDSAICAIGLAILANSRPYEGLIFSLPSLIVLGRWLLQSPKTREAVTRAGRWKRIALPAGAILLATAAFMGFYNWRLTGNALLFPHTLNVRTYHSAPMFLFQASNPPRHYTNQQFDDFYNGWERDEFDHSWESVKCLTWLKSVRFFSAFAWWGILLALPGFWFALRDRRLRLPLCSLAMVAIGAYVVVWSNAHYAAPITCVAILLTIQSLRHVRLMKSGKFHWGAILARTAVLLLLVDTVSAVVHKQCDTFHWTCQGDVSRAAARRKLEALPGKHLIMVRYSEDHNIHDDWVYNGAEIDSAKVIWAREISPEQDGKLLEYFKDRTIWLVTPDDDNTYLAPYKPPKTSRPLQERN